MCLNLLFSLIFFSICSDSFAAAKPKPVLFNGRAFECQPFEFSELNSMKKAELEGAYCSVRLGWESAHNSYTEMSAREQADNFRFGTAYSEKWAKMMDSCTSLNSKISELFSRKFGRGLSCSHFPPLPKPASESTDLPSQ